LSRTATAEPGLAPTFDMTPEQDRAEPSSAPAGAPGADPGDSSIKGGESSRERLARKGHRLRLQAYAVLTVAVLVYVVALGASNTRHVKVDWVFGHATVALVWLVVFAAILGWLMGIGITQLFRWRTRKPRAS
jgi:uncharacterized integral membrane protein